MKKKSKQTFFKKSDKIWFYLISFIFGFLPALGIAWVALANTSLLISLFPNFDPYFNLISIIIYVFSSIAIFFLSSPKATLFRKNFLISSILIFVLFFLINQAPYD